MRFADGVVPIGTRVIVNKRDNFVLEFFHIPCIDDRLL